MQAAMVKDTIMTILTNHGMDEDLLVQVLRVSLQNHTMTFMQQLIHAAVQRCSWEACYLLNQQEGLPALAQPSPEALRDSAQTSSPATDPMPLVGVPAAIPLSPLPLPPEHEGGAKGGCAQATHLQPGQ